MTEVYLIVAVFVIIGAGLKYIDEAFDEQIFDQGLAGFFAANLLILWIGISILDAGAATILLAILMGVLLTGKIDNSVFGISTAVIFGSLVFFKNIFFTPLVFLTISGIIDEKGNDYVDTHKSNKFLEFFFLHRFTMKIGLLALCAAGLLSLTYLLAFLLFDISYDGIGFISNSNKLRAEIENPLGNDTHIPSAS